MKHVARLVLSSLLVFGCAAHDAGDTGIQLDVTYDVPLDQLSISASFVQAGSDPSVAFAPMRRPDPPRALATTGESVIVLFDPSVAGDTFIARVDGLLSGSVVSSGAGSTRIVGGTITHLAIHLGAPAMCGDGVVVSLVEACDDGNLDAGDGCAVDCTIEMG